MYWQRVIFGKVSEVGLDPGSWWYIPKRGIHHHSKLTRQGPAGRISQAKKRRQHRPAGPVQACDLRKRRGQRGSAAPLVHHFRPSIT